MASHPPATFFPAENVLTEHVARCLVVGDGDLSYSLALARRYGEHVDVIAGTLCSPAELTATYAGAPRNVAELEERGARVAYGLDATDLAGGGFGPLDHVVFNHPHLGLSDLEDVGEHARRHIVLLAHFLAEASSVLAPRGLIHLTLCGNQRASWKLDEHVARLGLVLLESRHVAALPLFGRLATPPPPTNGAWQARRRFRDGTLGSRHALSAYGYEHRRTEGDGDVRSDKSVEIVLARAEGVAAAAAAAEVSSSAEEGSEGAATEEDAAMEEGAAEEDAGSPDRDATASTAADGAAECGAAGGGAADGAAEGAAEDGSHRCGVCGLAFRDETELRAHAFKLSRPDVWGKLPPAAPPDCVMSDGVGGRAPASGAELACAVCGEKMESRNRLFAHLRAGCAPGASAGAASTRRERLVLFAGYLAAASGEGHARTCQTPRTTPARQTPRAASNRNTQAQHPKRHTHSPHPNATLKRHTHSPHPLQTPPECQPSRTSSRLRPVARRLPQPRRYPPPQPHRSPSHKSRCTPSRKSLSARASSPRGSPAQRHPGAGAPELLRFRAIEEGLLHAARAGWGVTDGVSLAAPVQTERGAHAERNCFVLAVSSQLL